jgi:hypothetical protein
MTQINMDTVREIVNGLFVSRIKNCYGDEGIAVLKSVLEAVHGVFRSIEPEIIKGTILVFKNVSAIDEPGSGDWKQLTDLAYCVQESPTVAETYLNLHILTNGTVRYSKSKLDAAKLSESAVVYQYIDKTEGFIIKGKFEAIPNPYCPNASVFSIPTYSALKDALEDYKRRMIKTSKCPTFACTWHTGVGGPRLFFTRKPESKIRQSLSYFLDAVLRGAEVAPEQNVDETHPVDIKVTWMCSNRLALIEIKWLGKSVDEDGVITTEYSEYRANDGAKQLVEYIEANYRNTPIHNRRGYLVIVDARRKGLQKGATSISRQDGLWYQDSDITFAPAYHTIRMDFEEPIRMFAEPVCSTE